LSGEREIKPYRIETTEKAENERSNWTSQINIMAHEKKPRMRRRNIDGSRELSTTLLKDTLSQRTSWRVNSP